MKLLNSLEELLYEVMVMLVFFPRTLWLTMRYPQRMMDYADTELGDVLSGQYDDTLSPPLFLMICISVSHFIGQATVTVDTSALPSVFDNTENILIFRVILFSLFPLMLSLRLLHRLKIPLDRTSLRAPFYSQCFVAAPAAMMVGLCQSVARFVPGHSGAAGFACLLLVIVWYVRQQARWFQAKLLIGTLTAWRIAASTILGTIVVMFVGATAVLFSQGLTLK